MPDPQRDKLFGFARDETSAIVLHEALAGCLPETNQIHVAEFRAVLALLVERSVRRFAERVDILAGQVLTLPGGRARAPGGMTVRAMVLGITAPSNSA